MGTCRKLTSQIGVCIVQDDRVKAFFLGRWYTEKIPCCSGHLQWCLDDGDIPMKLLLRM